MKKNSDELQKDIEILVSKYFPLLHKKKKWKRGDYIPVAFAVYDENEIESLVRASVEFRYVDGSITNEFEKELARFLGVRHATFCNSGSSANLLAFMALTSPKLGDRALKPGDEVITSAVGFPTTVSPILQAGCVPVFVDISLTTYNPTPFQIEAAITEKTRAIFIAHTLGNPFDVEAIKDIAERNNLWLIEDCADAIGGEFNGKKVGTFGSISTTSFYPAHMMTTGEGGAVFTDSPILNLIIRSFRDWGRDCWCEPGKDNTCGKRFGWKNVGTLPDGYDHKYVYTHVGYNLKSTDLQASIGLEQLKKLPDFIDQRRINHSYMKARMLSEHFDDYFTLPTSYPRSNPAWFGYIITLKDKCKFTRTELTQFLESKKIGTRNLFGGNITRQPAFEGKGIISDMLPKSDIVMRSTFWVGIHPGMGDSQCDYIVDTIKEFLGSHK